MRAWKRLAKNPYFAVLGPLLVVECESDQKVMFLNELDLSAAERLRSLSAVRSGRKPSYTALVAKAVACALREQPEANRMVSGLPFFRRIIQLGEIHVSVAVERDRPGREQAVFVGTLRDTDRQDLLGITAELRSLAQATPETCPRWRTFQWVVERLPAALARMVLSMPRWFPGLWIEHRGGAALISSPAKYGVDAVVGAWPWPLAFSFGLVKDRPRVIDGQVAVRPTMTLTMSFDRRLMGGAPAARFFKRVVDLLEAPSEEFAGGLTHQEAYMDGRNARQEEWSVSVCQGP